MARAKVVNLNGLDRKSDSFSKLCFVELVELQTERRTGGFTVCIARTARDRATAAAVVVVVS